MNYNNSNAGGIDTCMAMYALAALAASPEVPATPEEQ